MRPLKLTMQAFGPYANKVTVDFDKLGNNGIYLITGDTGAGKSTIFDGITYALFDKTSLEERDPSSLRSKYAKENTITEVELTFIYDGKQYSIKRTPQYEYITRNNTIGKKEPTVELTMPNGRVFTGKKRETDNKISEIIGLEYEQFRRIVMIAQGDFKQLLLDKKGRGEIFRKIFDTNPYLKLQDSLKEERKNLKKDCESSNKLIKQSIDELYYDVEDDLNIELEEIQGQASYNVEMTSKLVSKMNEKDGKQIAKIKEELDKLDKSLAELNQKAGAIAKIKKIQKTLEEAKEERKEADENSNKIKIEVEKAQKQKPKIEEDRKQVALLEKELEQYIDLEKRINVLDKIQDKQNSLIDNQVFLAKEIDNNDKEFEKNKKELEGLKDVDVEHQKVVSSLKTEKEVVEELKDFESQFNDYLDSQKLVNKLEKEYLDAADIAQESTNKYTEANRLFLDNQAGILAKTLANNKPCPVCGSLEHPNCAKSIDKAPSEDELKKLKKQMDVSLKEQENKSKALNILNGEIESAIKTLNKQAKKLLGSVDFDTVPNLLKEKNNEVKKIVGELEDNKEQLEAKQKRKVILDKTIQKAEQNIKEQINKLL